MIENIIIVLCIISVLSICLTGAFAIVSGFMNKKAVNAFLISIIGCVIIWIIKFIVVSPVDNMGNINKDLFVSLCAIIGWVGIVLLAVISIRNKGDN